MWLRMWTSESSVLGLYLTLYQFLLGALGRGGSRLSASIFSFTNGNDDRIYLAGLLIYLKNFFMVKSHNIKHTILPIFNCTVQRHKGHSHCCATPPIIHLEDEIMGLP